MPEFPQLLVFIGASLLLLLTPGPAVLFVVTRSVQLGRRAGVLSTLGLTAGSFVHVIAAVAGLSAIVVASAELFVGIKLLGGAYLVYLGVKTWLGSVPSLHEEIEKRPRPLRLFADGFLVNVFNPKPALFFLAFLPQFVDSSRGQAAAQLLLLGLVFSLLALVCDGGYALAAASLRPWLQSTRIWRRQRAVSGSVFVGLGVATVCTGRRP